MKYSYSGMNLKVGDVVRVVLDVQVNVILMDTLNYLKFIRGYGYDYYGGLAIESPFEIEVPRTGYWYIIINSGESTNAIDYSVDVITN